MFKKPLAAAVACAAVVTGPVAARAGAAPGSGTTERPTFVAQSGSSARLAVGDVVAHGERTGKVCTFDRGTKVTGRATQPGGYLIRLRVTRNCAVVVRKLAVHEDATECQYKSLEDEPKAGYRLPIVHVPAVAFADVDPIADIDAIANGFRQMGCVKYTILEQFGVTATEVYFDSLFWEKGDYVRKQTEPEGYCYASAFPVWTIRRCSGQYDPDGPRSIYAWGEGDFDHTTGPSYTQRARYDFVPANTPEFQWSCRLTRGSLPFLWSEDCYGNYFPV